MKRFCFLFLALILPLSAYGAEKENLKKYKAAAAKGAAWLAKNQNANGSFGNFPGLKVPGDVGITGLVLMAFAQCSPEVKKKHKEVIEKAVQYILKHQTKSGSFINPGRGLDNYKTCVSIMALARLDRKRFAKEIERAKGFLVRTQFSENSFRPGPEAGSVELELIPNDK